MHLPTERIEVDHNQPRKGLTDTPDPRLLNSIRTRGIQQPPVVYEQEEGWYRIIDGHRRYLCAKALGLKTIPCWVHKQLPKGEFDILRFDTQDNRKDWKPLERSDAFERIKEQRGIKTNTELAKVLGISEGVISLSLKLRSQNIEFLGLMEKYELPETYRAEFLRLKPKLCRIRDLSVGKITLILFEKVKTGTLKNAKGFRQLRRIFQRARLNENELYTFLTTPTMTVADLEKRTVQSGPSLLVEKLHVELGNVFAKGVKIAEQDSLRYVQLRDLLLSKFPLTSAA